jgi:hypothetical protein
LASITPKRQATDAMIPRQTHLDAILATLTIDDDLLRQLR